MMRDVRKDNGAASPSGTGGTGRDSGGATDSDGGATSEAASPSTPDANAPQSEFESGPPHVQFIGRFDTTDSAGPRCGWPGCRIVARFDGTAVKAHLKDYWEDYMKGAPSEWDVAIDGVIKNKIVMTANDTEYDLASGLAKGPHVVELYKRSEAQNGTTQFLGFDFEGGTLMSPPSRRTRHIEIIGDSAASGFGVEGVGYTDAGHCPGIEWAATWQDFRKSFGPQLGEFVNAEVYGSVFSGKGISQNIWTTDSETLPVLFERTLPTYTNGTTWDTKQWQADVVIIMAGGNDFEIREPTDTGPATLEQFTNAYAQFVAKLRADYPSAHIVLTVSSSLSDDQPAGRQSRTNTVAGVHAVASQRNSQGDARVYAFELDLAQPGEMVGCMSHGSEQSHARIAGELAAFIKPKLGW